jgi:hypothetical protein
MSLPHLISSKCIRCSPVKPEGGDAGKYRHILYVKVTHTIKETHCLPTYGDKEGRNIILIIKSIV